MDTLKKIAIGTASAAAVVGLSVANYRRFMPKAQPLGGQKYEVKVTPLPVDTGRHTLYGELLLPVGRVGKMPTVICCHGFGSSYKLCKNTMGMCLAMSGYAVYVFDFWGGSKKSRSGGSMLEMSIFTEREDLSAVIEKIKTLPTTDPDNLFLLGESQGGCVAGITAPRYAEDLRAMVQYYPAYCIPDDARAKFQTVEDIPPVSKTFGLDVGKVYNEKLLDFDVYEEIKAFDKPVLIMHGDNDKTVDISYGRKAAQVYPDAEFVLFPGEIHGFYGKGKLKGAKLAYAFFNRNLKV